MICGRNRVVFAIFHGKSSAFNAVRGKGGRGGVFGPPPAGGAVYGLLCADGEEFCANDSLWLARASEIRLGRARWGVTDVAGGGSCLPILRWKEVSGSLPTEVVKDGCPYRRHARL